MQYTIFLDTSIPELLLTLDLAMLIDVDQSPIILEV